MSHDENEKKSRCHGCGENMHHASTVYTPLGRSSAQAKAMSYFEAGKHSHHAPAEKENDSESEDGDETHDSKSEKGDSEGEEKHETGHDYGKQGHGHSTTIHHHFMQHRHPIIVHHKGRHYVIHHAGSGASAHPVLHHPNFESHHEKHRDKNGHGVYHVHVKEGANVQVHHFRINHSGHAHSGHLLLHDAQGHKGHVSHTAHVFTHNGATHIAVVHHHNIPPKRKHPVPTKSGQGRVQGHRGGHH
ncbi:hypothetical protein T439DRAFT_352184 [Meredithblackwellia eburnea MCA 4105]